MNTLAIPFSLERERPPRRHETLLLAALCSAAGADFLFRNAAVGCSVAVFAFGVLLILILTGGRSNEGRPCASTSILFSAGILGLCISFIEEPTTLGVFLCSIGLICLSLHQHDRLGVTPGEWGSRIFRFIVSSPLCILLDGATGLRWIHRHPTGVGTKTVRSMMRWIFPVLLSAVFLGLFALANPIVSNGISRAVDALDRWTSYIPELLDVLRMLFWAVITAVVYALLRPRILGRRRSVHALGRGYAAYMAAQPPPMPETVLALRESALGLVVRCLIAFNVVFAIENFLDATYLFGGLSLPNGMTYAEYAHRGSYPLVAAALLAGLFILIAFRPGGYAERSRAARGLVFGWLAQTLFLTCSSIWRLDLYVDAYSLTQLRLAAAIWMLMVVLGLLWIFGRILLHRSNSWLLRANLFTAVAILYACTFINTRGFVADYNVSHCREASGAGPAIDVAYLRSLGPEARPALQHVLPLIHDSEKSNRANAFIRQLDARLSRDLSNWRGWTFRRARIQSSN